MMARLGAEVGTRTMRGVRLEGWLRVDNGEGEKKSGEVAFRRGTP